MTKKSKILITFKFFRFKIILSQKLKSLLLKNFRRFINLVLLILGSPGNKGDQGSIGQKGSPGPQVINGFYLITII